MKILGVIIDDKFNFNEHVKYIIEKGNKSYSKLKGLCNSTWGLSPEVMRLLYTAVIEPTIIYASSVWQQTINRNYTRKLLATFQRNCAKMIIKSFHTIFHTAALAIANLLSIDLRIIECGKLVFSRRKLLLPSDLLSRNRNINRTSITFQISYMLVSQFILLKNVYLLFLQNIIFYKNSYYRPFNY